MTPLAMGAGKMPELLIHFATGLLLGSPRHNWRHRLLIVLASMLPDIDALFHVHRSFTHSLLILVPLLAIIVFLNKKSRSKDLVNLACLVLLAYSLHIAMDLFTAPTPILWPILDKELYIETTVSLDNTLADKLVLETNIELHVIDHNPRPRDIVGAPIATPIGVATTLAILATLLVNKVVAPRKKHV